MKRVVEVTGRVRVGNPLDPETMVAAIINDAQKEKTLSQVEEARRVGDTTLGDGTIKHGNASFFQPTVIDRVTPDMSGATGEISGPVLCVLRFRKSRSKKARNATNDFSDPVGAEIKA